MPHSDDKPNGWDRPEDSSGVPTGRAERPRADDPLAELARMVDEDPFADFRRDPPRAGRDQADPPPQSYGPPQPKVPDTTAEPRVDRDSLYAEITAAQEREAQTMAAPEEVEPETFEPEQAETDLAIPEWDEPEWPEPEAAGSETAGHQWTDPAPSAPDPEVQHEVPGFDPVAALAAELQAMPPEAGVITSQTSEPRAAEAVEPWFNEWAEPSAQNEPAESGNWAQDDHAAHWPEQQPAEAYADAQSAPHFAEAELPFAEAPADDGYVPTYVADDRQHSDYEPAFNDADSYGSGAYEEERRGGRRGVMVVSSLVALVVLGGAAALAYRGLTGEVGGPTGEPPVIRADSAPAKMAADEPEEAAEGQGKLVYDRIGGGGSDGDSRIVSREEPVFDVEARDEAPLRVIDSSDESVQATDRGRRADPDQPRRVRTVVVRPDGTVVSNPEQVDTALQPASDVQTMDLAAGDEGSPRPQSRSADGETDSVETTAAIGDEEEAFDPPSAEQTDSQAQAPESDSQTGTQSRSGQPLQLMPQGGETASAGQSQESEQVAQAPTTTPQSPSENTAQPATFPSGSYIVQVGSTRSESDARGSASAVAQRHGDLLSGYQTAIERADLGDRGVFYRVGVGPVDSQSDADALCGSLRSAGTDCFVRRN